MYKLLLLLTVFCFSIQTIARCQEEISSVDDEIQKVYQKYFYQLQGNNFYSNIYQDNKKGIVFLENFEEKTGEIVDPNPDCVTSKIMVHFLVFYYFHPENNIFSLKYHLSEKDLDTFHTKIIVGSHILLNDKFSSGAGNSFIAIQELPGYKDEIAIYEIDSLGTVFFRFENKFYKLKIGEKVVISSSYIRPPRISNDVYKECQIKEICKKTITNYGYLNKIEFE